MEGTLTATTINLTAGTLDVVGGGEIAGATITAGPGTSFQAVDGTFAGTTTWQGSLLLNGITQAQLLTVTGSTDITGALSGNGTIDLSSGATLELGGTASGGTIEFDDAGSTLKLDAPSGFSETIFGLTTGDVIDLVGTSVKSAVISGSTLSVTETNNTVLTYQLASGNPLIRFAVKSDGAGGSDLTVSNQLTERSDFNGGGSDILWRNNATGAVETWLMTNGLVTGGSGSLRLSVWQVLGTGDSVTAPRCVWRNQQRRSDTW